MWYYADSGKSIIYPKSQYFDLEILASGGLMRKTSLPAKFGALTEQ